MGEADKKKEKSEGRFSEEQYDMLKRCSERWEVLYGNDIYIVRLWKRSAQF